MTWRDLVSEPQMFALPWLGGRQLALGVRRWHLDGELPPEHGWYLFDIGGGRRATFDSRRVRPHPIPIVPLAGTVRGIAIGDRFVPDDAAVPVNEDDLVAHCETVHLIDSMVQPFQAVLAARLYEGGPLVYDSPAMPEIASQALQQAFEDGRRDISAVQGVTPALDLAFRLLWKQRDDAERRRIEIDRLERLAELERAGGTAVGRRRLAVEDFERAARAALAAGGAEYLSHQQGARPTEMVVRFRTMHERFECVVDARSLAIVDAGICLVDNRTGRRWDSSLSLESLPGVCREALENYVLHRFRYA